jgi:hypothetical protein
LSAEEKQALCCVLKKVKLQTKIFLYKNQNKSIIFAIAKKVFL